MKKTKVISLTGIKKEKVVKKRDKERARKNDMMRNEEEERSRELEEELQKLRRT